MPFSFNLGGLIGFDSRQDGSTGLTLAGVRIATGPQGVQLGVNVGLGAEINGKGLNAQAGAGITVGKHGLGVAADAGAVAGDRKADCEAAAASDGHKSARATAEKSESIDFVKGAKNIDDAVRRLRVHNRNVQVSVDAPAGIHTGITKFIKKNNFQKEVDDGLQMAILSVHKDFDAIQKKNGHLTWANVNSVLEKHRAKNGGRKEEDQVRCRSQMFHKVFAKIDGSPDRQMHQRALDEMKKCVGNEGIFNKLRINLNTIASTFAAEGVTPSGPVGLVARSVLTAKMAVDVGTIRFPDAENTSFEVYRFRVLSFREEEALTVVNFKHAGLVMEFSRVVYYMSDRWMDAYKSQLNAGARQEFQKMLADLVC